MNSSSQPASRAIVTRELERETAERLSRIDSEFANGYNLINRFNDTVTIFGSARFAPSHRYYQKAVEVAEALSNQGYAIVTGGGPGIMEAANKGAFQAGGASIGMGIELPHEQELNPYVTNTLSFRYFFSRKVIMAFGASGYVYFPGGYGTLDEFFEIITLIQTGKMPIAPMVLVGHEFWQPLDTFITHQLLDGQHTISPGDQDLYTITEDTAQVVAIINKHRDQYNGFAAPSTTPLAFAQGAPSQTKHQESQPPRPTFK